MFTHDLVSELVKRLRENNGDEAEGIIRTIEEGAKKFVCPTCGLDIDDPFVGASEEPKFKIFLYCPVCNEHKMPLELHAFDLVPRLGVACTGGGHGFELCKKIGCGPEGGEHEESDG